MLRSKTFNPRWNRPFPQILISSAWGQATVSRQIFHTAFSGRLFCNFPTNEAITHDEPSEKTTFLDGFSLASAYFGRKFLFTIFILSVLSKSNSSLRSSQAFLSIIDLFNSEKYFSCHMIDCWLVGDNFRRSESDYFLDKWLTNLEPRDLNNGNSTSLGTWTFQLHLNCSKQIELWFLVIRITVKIKTPIIPLIEQQ